MKNFDVIIVGAGPAGIAAAQTLLKSKIDFCIIEKETFPRKKLCAGGMTNKCVELLEELKLEYKNVIKQVITSVQIGSKNKVNELTINDPVIMVDRTEFDNNNLSQIKKQNKNVFEKEYVINIEENILTTNKNEYKFKYIIFADGVNGYSRKLSNLKNIGFCVEFDIENRNDKSAVLSFDAIRDGYAWIFPKGNYSTIGLGKFKNVKDDYKKLLLDFCKSKDIEVKNEKILGFPIPNGSYLKSSVIDDNKILVGDAGGLVDPISGEGIYYALLSGKFSAESIIEKLKNNNINLPKSYNKKVKVIHRALAKKMFISKLFYSPLKNILITIAFSNKFFKKLATKIVL